MNKNLVVFISAFLCLGATLSAQTVSNVRFEQENSRVKITYSLDKTADITISVSEDGGKTWRAPLKQVSGGVGKQVQPGSKTIYWNVLAEYDQFVGNNICFKISTQGGSAVRTITVHGVSFTMIRVEGGTFTMGATPEQESDACDEMPIHQVTLSDYYISQTEVTQALWQAVMGSNPSYYKGNNLPVHSISWDDCQTFIRKLSSLTGLRFTLPTEAQWEYAARGGKKSKGYKYAGSNSVGQVAWYKDNSNSKTHDVATKQPNELGLYDMSGNVWEWCQDWHAWSYSSAAQTNPIGVSSGVLRVHRGGGYNCVARSCQISYRGKQNPDYKGKTYGLRLVLLP